MTCSLSPDLQIVQKIPENITFVYVNQLAKFGDLISLVQKIYWKMHPVSCANTHQHVIDLVNHGMIKIQKLECLENIA